MPRTTQVDMSTTEATSSVDEGRTMHLFLTRGVIAIAWAACLRGGVALRHD
jgi:hypothetical protein